MTYAPKNILVTGGAGFIASHFVRYYQTHYPNGFIINLDKLSYAGSLDNVKDLPYPNNHHFVQGDILDSQLLARLLRDFKVDTIVHFAAETHVDRSIDSPENFIQTNITGTFTLLEASRQYWLEEQGLSETACRFHHISTDEVYGSLQKGEAAFNELTPYRPNSPYSASKAGSDHLVRAYYQTYGLPISITNCSNNYGPLQHSEKFIPTIIDRCLKQKSIPVYGNGSNIRDWLYVEDHCRGIDIVIREGKLGGRYNIGGNNELTNLEVIYAVCEELNKIKPVANNYVDLITFVKDRAGHDWRYAINAEKIRKELNWQPKETFSSGLLKTLSTHPMNTK
ncbi:MAG: dTDP-glucose 4,6-dehydratase [Pseudomonadota bacterium]